LSVHPDGTGTGWTNVEAVDVNQPHGLDYLYSQHIAKGVRKRMNQEHSAFADATVGGIHKPGGCAVLAVEITDDCTAPVVADGTYRARGLIWAHSKDTSNYGVLFCNTAAAGASTTGDWTVLKMHPDLQWSGGDVTWAGAHEFDASVDISGNVAMDGDCTIDGVLKVDSSVDFSDVYIAGDCSVDSTFTVGGDAAFVSDVSIDGTLAMQNVVLTGDSTFTFDPIAGETGPTFNHLGDWSARANNTTYTARTDGEVYAIKTGSTSAQKIEGDTPSGTLKQVATNLSAAGVGSLSINFKVKKGDTWDVSGASTVYWLPYGDNT
jgi:hypothetical protein